jgi:hypothetical protein
MIVLIIIIIIGVVVISTLEMVDIMLECAAFLQRLFMSRFLNKKEQL